MTNYEHIKAMSVEEMAKRFVTYVPNPSGYNYKGIDGFYRKTKKAIVAENVKWLNSEVKE